MNVFVPDAHKVVVYTDPKGHTVVRQNILPGLNVEVQTVESVKDLPNDGLPFEQQTQ